MEAERRNGAGGPCSGPGVGAGVGVGFGVGVGVCGCVEMWQGCEAGSGQA